LHDAIPSHVGCRAEMKIGREARRYGKPQVRGAQGAISKITRCDFSLFLAVAPGERRAGSRTFAEV
jgi:hypothetical protein